MAASIVGLVASGNEKPGSADNSLVVTFTATTNVNDVLHLGLSYDNLSASTPIVSSVVDSRGNLWAQVADSDASTATAAGGVRCTVWKCVAYVAHQVGDTLTITLSGTVVAKAGAVCCTRAALPELLGYLSLPGSGGSYVSTPDSSANSILSDITIDVSCRMTSWTPATQQVFVSKWVVTGNQKSIQFYINSNGTLQVTISSNGSTSVNGTSTVAVGAAAGTDLWVRMTFNDTTNVLRFWTSSDGVTWTQLGTNVSYAVAGIFDSTSPLEIGATLAGTTQQFNGRIYKVNLYNSDLGNGAGTPVVTFDPNGPWPDSNGVVWSCNGSATVFSTPGGLTTTRGTAGQTALLVTPANTKDVVIGFTATEDNAVAGGDTDTTAGSWTAAAGSAATGGGATSDAAIMFQAKAVTATTQQSWASTYSGDHSAIAFSVLSGADLTSTLTDTLGGLDDVSSSQYQTAFTIGDVLGELDNVSSSTTKPITDLLGALDSYLNNLSHDVVDPLGEVDNIWQAWVTAGFDLNVTDPLGLLDDIGISRFASVSDVLGLTDIPPGAALTLIDWEDNVNRFAGAISAFLTADVSSVQVHGGTKAQRIRCTASAGGNFSSSPGMSSTGWVAVSPGDHVYADLWVYNGTTADPNTMLLRILELDSSGAFLKQPVNAFVNAWSLGVWTYAYIGGFTVDPGASYVTLGIAPNWEFVGDAWYFDDLTFYVNAQRVFPAHGFVLTPFNIGSIGLVDSRLVNLVKEITDPNGLVDSSTQVANAAQSSNESLGLLDAAGQQLDALQEVDDVLDEVDDVTSDLTGVSGTDFAAEADEALGLLDDAGQALDAAQEVDDLLGEVDSIAQAYDASRSSDETLGLLDTTGQAADAFRQQDDAEGILDNAATNEELAVEQDDQAGLLDTPLQEFSSLQELADLLGTTDSTPQMLEALRTFNEQLDELDDVSQEASYERTAPDLLGELDDVSQESVADQTMGEQLDLTDDTAQLSSFGREADDLMELLDQAAQLYDARRTLTESFGLVDAAMATAQYVAQVTSALGLLDAAQRITTTDRALQDSQLISDAIAQVSSAGRDLSDSVGLLDDLLRYFEHSTTDQLRLLDELDQAADYAQELNDLLGLDDPDLVAHVRHFVFSLVALRRIYRVNNQATYRRTAVREYLLSAAERYRRDARR